MDCNSGTAPDVSLQHDDDSCSSFMTEFRLYMPKADAKSVWMEISKAERAGQHVKMVQSTTEPRLWLATCTVTNGDKYYYGAKVNAGWYGLKTEKILENDSRDVKRNSVHRDIFTSVEKKIVDRIDGWKFFFVEAISTIGTRETQSHVQILLSEYFQLDHEFLRPAEQQKLGRFATGYASKVALDPFIAAFVIYYLSCVYDNALSMIYSNIREQDAIRLLSSVKDWHLQEFLGAHFSRRITETMLYLVKVGSKSADWDSFVLWCYPSLSSTEILSMFEPSGYSPKSALVSKLCSYTDQEDATHILSVIMSHVTSLSALCQVVKTCSQLGTKAHLKLLDQCWPYFVKCIKTQLGKIYTIRHLKDLSDMAELAFSVNCESVSEVLPSFEQKLLDILDSREDASQYVQQLEKIVSNPAVFRDKGKAVKLFQILARSSHRSNHGLLPKFLHLQKFSVLLNDEEILQLIEEWLGSIAGIVYIFASQPKTVCDLRKYILQVSNLPDEVPHEVKIEIKKMCMKTFCNLALPSITKLPNVLYLEVLQELVCEMKDEDIQPVEEFRSAVEAVIINTVSKASTREHAQILVHLLLNEKLFVEADCSAKVLELVAESRLQNIHNAFLDIMTGEKFWKILSTGECERIFGQWFSEAIHHCFYKARKRRSGTVDYYILFLYEYVTDVLALPSVKSNEAVRNQVEISVKKQFVRFEPMNIIDMLDSAANEIKEDAVKLLEQHLQNAEIKKLMTEREYHSELDRFVASVSDDWKVQRRYCFKI